MSLFGNSTNKAPGLSINTGTANLFSSNTNPSQQSQPQSSNSLFANAAATTKPSLFTNTASTAASAGTLFGAGTNNATSAPSLFGNTATSAPSQAGTLFGGTAANQPPGGSLFGTSTAATTQSTGGGPFGTAPATSQSAASGGLFGSAMTSQPAATGGLFGAKPAGTQTTSMLGGNTGGGGLFGGATQQKPAQSTSLFGQQPAQQTQSLFGQPANAPAPNANSSLFGNAASQSSRPALNQPQQVAPQQTQRSIFTSSIGQYTAAQATVPGVRVDAGNLRPTTRFADLHEVLQQELERLDDLILRQQKHAEECEQAMPAVSHALSYVPADAEYCARKLDAMQSALEADAGDIDDLKSKTGACADDAKTCFKNVSALRTPAQFSVGPGAGPVPAGLLDGGDPATSGKDLHRYVERQIDEMTAKLDKFKTGLAEVENYLGGVESTTFAGLEAARLRSGRDGMRRSADDQIRELAGVLREFEGGIMGVATKVGGLREKTQEVMLDDSRPRRRLGGLY